MELEVAALSSLCNGREEGREWTESVKPVQDNRHHSGVFALPPPPPGPALTRFEEHRTIPRVQ